MEFKKCLADYWRSNPEAPRLLEITKEQLQSYIEKGVTGNPMLFFKMAAILDASYSAVDGYSDLPEPNRTTIYALLSERATIDDYLLETKFSRDAFMRNLRGARFFSEKNQELIVKANAKFISGIKPEIKKSETISQTEINHDLIFNLIVAAAANAITLEKELDNYLATSTEDDRKDLRDKLLKSQFGLFPASNATHRLSQRLNALCSEKALENYRLNKQKY